MSEKIKVSELTESNTVDNDDLIMIVQENNSNELENFKQKRSSFFNGIAKTSDLTDYVKNTDYATVDTAGVIKANSYYALGMYQGNIFAQTKTNEQYSTAENGIFISKGTLDNVLNARIGDISTILQTLDTGSGV